jgi:glutathione-independent formaldehyde dehydrogenase
MGAGDEPAAVRNVEPSLYMCEGHLRGGYILAQILQLPLGRAPEAYEHFDRRDDGWTKVVLHPTMAEAGV